MERLQEKFNKEIAPALKQKYSFKNVFQVPKITKVVVNVGLGKFKDDKKKIDSVYEDLKKITGQAGVKNRARKSISGFKIRENQIVGISTTLRGDRMYSFLDKLINIALPRVRDFQGISDKGFDKRGSFHLGLKEHIVFPEVPADSLENIFGLEVSIVISGGKDEHSKELLKMTGFPFKK